MTALVFDLDPVDAAVIAALKAPGNLPVYVGSVGGSDPDALVIAASLPYVLYGSTLPFDSGPGRVGGRRANTTDFTVTSAHSTMEGAKAVALAVRGLLDGAPLMIGGRIHRIRLDAPDQPVHVERDQKWTRPGGLPLFFAVDRFHVF